MSKITIPKMTQEQRESTLETLAAITALMIKHEVTAAQIMAYDYWSDMTELAEDAKAMAPDQDATPASMHETMLECATLTFEDDILDAVEELYLNTESEGGQQ